GNPEEIYEQEEKARSLFSAINQLNAEFRAAVDLHLKEHTLGEAAEILRVALGTVKARLFRARRQLRALIGRNTRSTNQTASLGRRNVQNGPFGKNKILGANHE